MSIRIAAFCGSLRQNSYNRKLLQAACELAAAEDVVIEEIDYRDFPLYDADIQAEGFPEVVLQAGQQVRAAGAVLFVSPEYNYSVPGALKNALDWLSRLPEQPFSGKATAIMGTSPGNTGTSRMQYHLRQILVFLNAFPVNRPEVMVGSYSDKFAADGTLTDAKTREKVAELLASLAHWSRKLALNP